jgi:hypothetical protein
MAEVIRGAALSEGSVEGFVDGLLGCEPALEERPFPASEGCVGLDVEDCALACPEVGVLIFEVFE